MEAPGTPARGRLSSRARRVLIAIAGALLIAGALFLALIVLILPVGCEDFGEDDVGTVLCESDRGAGWRSLIYVLLLLAVAAPIAALAVGVTRARAWPLAAGAAVSLLTLYGAAQIYDVRVEDAPVPPLSDARMLEPSCRVTSPPPCADGLPVEFRLSEPAEIQLLVGRRVFRPGAPRARARILGRAAAPGGPVWGLVYGFRPGRHVVRVVGELVSGDPLPPGAYELTITAHVDERTGNANGATLPFEVRPG